MDANELEALLKNPLVDTRLQAARKFSALGTFDEKLFLLALGDNDWRVRKEAIGFFMAQPDAVSRIELLIDQLHHPDNAGLRNAAIEILIAFGSKISKTLLDRLESEDAEVRKFIIDILGEICHAGCAKELLPYLHDKDENVRYAVVETLGKLGSVDTVDALLDQLDSSSAGLQFAVLEALKSIGKGVPAQRILPYAENALLRKSVLNCLGQLADPAAIPILLNALSDPMRKNREVALLAFGQLIKELSEKDCPEVDPQSDQVVEQMFSYLQHENIAYRRAACYVLSLFPNVEVVSRLLPLLAEEELRADVVAAAKLIPKVIWGSMVAETGLTDSKALFLIYLLGELADPGIQSLAVSALTSADPQLRYVAVTALGKICAQEMVTQIGDLLNDEIPDVREAASVALCQIGAVDPAGVVKTVSPYLEAADTGLRLLAVRTLGGLTIESVEYHLLLALKDADAQVRCEALRGLAGHTSPRLFSGLSLALTDEVADVRRLAAVAIGGFSAKRATPILKHALDDNDPWVRMEALRALRGGRDAEVLSIVERGLADPVGLVVIAALETAQRLLADKAEPFLRVALNHKDLEVCGTAVRLLFNAETAVTLLSDDRAAIRLQVVQEFSKVANRQLLLALEERLEEEPDDEVCLAIETVLRNGVVES